MERMSERKAVTLAGMGVVLLSALVCAGLTLLGLQRELVVVATFVSFGVGIDRVSKLIMSYETPGEP
jgi:hypothetical protein